MKDWMPWYGLFGPRIISSGLITHLIWLQLHFHFLQFCYFNITFTFCLIEILSCFDLLVVESFSFIWLACTTPWSPLSTIENPNDTSRAWFSVRIPEQLIRISFNFYHSIIFNWRKISGFKSEVEAEARGCRRKQNSKRNSTPPGKRWNFHHVNQYWLWMCFIVERIVDFILTISYSQGSPRSKCASFSRCGACLMPYWLIDTDIWVQVVSVDSMLQ